MSFSVNDRNGTEVHVKFFCGVLNVFEERVPMRMMNFDESHTNFNYDCIDFNSLVGSFVEKGLAQLSISTLPRRC